MFAARHRAARCAAAVAARPARFLSVLDAWQASVCGRGEAEVRDFGVWACLLNDLGGVKEVHSVVIVLLHPLCANTCHAPACTYTRKPLCPVHACARIGLRLLCFASRERGAQPDQPGYHVCKGQGQHWDEPAVALCDVMARDGSVVCWRALSARTVPIARMVGSKMRKGYTHPPVQVWQMRA